MNLTKQFWGFGESLETCNDNSCAITFPPVTEEKKTPIEPFRLLSLAETTILSDTTAEICVINIINIIMPRYKTILAKQKQTTWAPSFADNYGVIIYLCLHEYSGGVLF